MWCTVQESKRSRRVSWLTSSLTWWGHIFCKDAWIQSNLNQTKLWALKWVERRRLCTDYQVLLTRHLWHDLKFDTDVIIGMIFIDFLFVCKKKSRFVKKEEKITWWWSTSQKVKVWGRGRGTANVNITSKPI